MPVESINPVPAEVKPPAPVEEKNAPERAENPTPQKEAEESQNIPGNPLETVTGVGENVDIIV